MQIVIKTLKNTSGQLRKYAVSKEEILKAGDFGYNNENEVVQVNQSTCIFHSEKVIGEINQELPLNDGDIATILFKCKNKSDCNYPFCSGSCEGNDGFYVSGYEERGY